MSTNASRVSDAIDRLLPFIVALVILVVAYFWFIQAPLNAYLRTRADVVALEARVKTLRDATTRAAGAPAVDMQASMREFDRQMSREDKVADVSALLAKAVLDSAPPDQLREFAIETSDRIRADNEGPRMAPRVSTGTASAVPDPRMSLFPTGVSYTPVKVTFASTFEAIASFMWKVRDLPTIVEIKSATLTRGLPLMKMELLIWVYQRGDEQAAPPPPGSPTGPTVPHVAQSVGAEG